MSINNFTNFNMPSLNGLVDVNADSVNSSYIYGDDINSNVINTQSIYVDGVDLAQQVISNAQKLTAIQYSDTPTPTTTIDSNLLVTELAEFDANVNVNGNFDVDGFTTLNGVRVDGDIAMNANVQMNNSIFDLKGQMFLRDTTEPNTVYMKIYYEPSLFGFNFQQESIGRYFYFRCRGPSGNYRGLQFNFDTMYTNLPFAMESPLKIYDNILMFNDNYQIRCIPVGGENNGLWLTSGRNGHYINLRNNDLVGNAVYTFRTCYNQINSLVNHVFDNTATFNNKLLCNANVKLNSSSGLELSTPALTLSQTTLSYLSGVSSNIQNQLNDKPNLSTINTFLNSNEFVSPVTFNNGIIAGTTSLSNTVLSHLSGVSSNIQTQLNNKINSTGATITGNLILNQSLGASSNSHLQITDTVSNNGLKFLPNSSLLATNQFVGSSESVISTNQNNSSLVLTSANTTLPFGIRISSSSSSSGTITMRVGSNNSIIVNQTSNAINGNLNIAGPDVNFLSGTNVVYSNGLNITNNSPLITNGPISFSGGTTINTNYGTIYNASLNLTTLTTGSEINVSNALTLPNGIYMITWIATFHVITGSTTVGNFSSGYTTSTSAYSDYITRGSQNNQNMDVDNYFSLSGCTCASFSTSTNIYLRVSAIFGTANRLEFVADISSLRAVKIA